MGAAHKSKIAAVFFCSLGWVYTGPALGQTGGDGADPAVGDARSALFAETPSPLSPAADAALATGQNVGINERGHIDLHVKDLEVAKVLQLLSIQSERNIIASKNVAGSVSADLFGVDFYEALDAVLHPNGFGYREKGSFIYVYTQQELEEMDKATRKAVVRRVELNYMSAADAAAFVQPLLSSSGAITVSAEAPASMQPTLSDAGANSLASNDTLVIRDYEENVTEITNLITELDARPKQVLVEATILQAKLTEANALGVDFALFSDLDVANLASPLGAVNELITGAAQANGERSGQAIVNNPGNTLNGQSSVKIGIVGSDAAVYVRALQSMTDTTVLSNPKMLVLNRQRAELLVGEKLGYLSTTQTETSATTTVEFLEVGTQLTVRPFVSNDGFIRLELKPQVSDGVTSVQAGFVIPTEQTSEMTTNVIVRNGTTVILGGLFKEDTTVDRKQTPFLGDIPIAGAAFRGQDDNVERSEVIFMVKPTIVKDEALVKMGAAAKEDAELTMMGAHQGLLPWSKTRLTQSHLRDAREAMAKGDKKKALWSANLALYLDPTFVEAMRVREQITGEKVYCSDRSILNRSIDKFIDDAVPAAALEPAADATATPAEPATDDAAATTEVESSDAATVTEDVATVETPAATADDMTATDATEPPATEPAAEAEVDAAVENVDVVVEQPEVLTEEAPVAPLVESPEAPAPAAPVTIAEPVSDAGRPAWVPVPEVIDIDALRAGNGEPLVEFLGSDPSRLPAQGEQTVVEAPQARPVEVVEPDVKSTDKVSVLEVISDVLPGEPTISDATETQVTEVPIIDLDMLELEIRDR